MLIPKVLENYIQANNKHDVKKMLECFDEKAVVYDEGEELKGRKLIEKWISSTTDKYQCIYRPLALKESVLTMEVTGTFPGSPVKLNYHFALENEKITSLRIV